MVMKWIVGLWRATRSVITSPRARKYRTWIFQGYILAALVAFSFLALLVNISPYLGFDLSTTRELQEDLPAWMGGLMVAISWPGFAAQALALVSSVFIILYILGLRWEAFGAVFAAVSSSSVNYLVKVAIRRPRPSADLVDVFTTLNSYSFPSGHVMFYTAFFGFLLFLAYVLLKRSIRRTAALLLFLFMILSVGVSRMYLGEHWASDVIGGYILGSLMLILTILFYRWGKSRLQSDQPVAPESEKEA